MQTNNLFNAFVCRRNWLFLVSFQFLFYSLVAVFVLRLFFFSSLASAAAEKFAAPKKKKKQHKKWNANFVWAKHKCINWTRDEMRVNKTWFFVFSFLWDFEKLEIPRHDFVWSTDSCISFSIWERLGVSVTARTAKCDVDSFSQFGHAQNSEEIRRMKTVKCCVTKTKLSTCETHCFSPISHLMPSHNKTQNFCSQRKLFDSSLQRHLERNISIYSLARSK